MNDMLLPPWRCCGSGRDCGGGGGDPDRGCCCCCLACACCGACACALLLLPAMSADEAEARRRPISAVEATLESGVRRRDRHRTNAATTPTGGRISCCGDGIVKSSLDDRLRPVGVRSSRCRGTETSRRPKRHGNERQRLLQDARASHRRRTGKRTVILAPAHPSPYERLSAIQVRTGVRTRVRPRVSLY